MRKLLWVIGLVLVVTGAPNAYADSFDASFTCTGSCVSMPTDPFVTFPSPNIPISFFSETFTITLNSLDNPTDSFTWDVAVSGSNWDFVINDLTDGVSDTSPSYSFSGSGTAPYGSGTVCFTSVPEPSPYALMLLGLGIVFAVRKLMSHRLPQAT